MCTVPHHHLHQNPPRQLPAGKPQIELTKDINKKYELEIFNY